MKLSELVYNEIDNDPYLNEIYSSILENYSRYYLPIQEHTYIDFEINDALRFADILSKSIHPDKSALHKNIAQEMVVLLNCLYPNNPSIEYVMGSVLSNISNFKGLDIELKDKKDFRSSDAFENLYYNKLKNILKIPGSDFYFFKDQKNIYDNFENIYYSYSGPTSMGKSFVMRMFIKNKILLGDKKNFIIIVPTKALINEISGKIILDLNDQLKKKKYRVITSPESLLLDKEYNFIMVLTPERLLHFMITKHDFQIDYLFIDEAHKISSKDPRSVFYYKIVDLASKNDTTHIFFSAPYVPNPKVYLDLIPKKQELKLDGNFNYSPVTQIKYLVDINSTEVALYNNLSDKYIKRFKIDCTNSIDFIQNFTNFQNIVYCNSTETAIQNAKELASRLDTVENIQLNELILMVKNNIHADYFLVEILKKGIAYHVGYIPSEIRVFIEKLFREGIIKTIFCTSTLLEGVNLPADNLFITSYKIGLSHFKPIDFKNLIGRAGRIEYNLYGNVFLLSEDDKSKEKFEELLIENIEEQKVTLELTKKEKIQIISSLSDGKIEIEKPENLNDDKYTSMRKYSLILLKDILSNNKNSYIYKQFSELLSESDLISIKTNFKKDYIDDNINISFDQTENLIQSIEGGLNYPTEFDYETVLKFLEKLSVIFKWEVYEKNTLGSGSIRWYAVILTQWIQGQGLPQIIKKSIDYKKNRKGSIIYVKGKRVTYTHTNEHKNYIINDVLSTIENIILFKFTSYFLKFSMEYKRIHKLENLSNDWYEYVEYGTNKPLSISLQKYGLSREISTYIKINESKFVIDSNDTFYLRKTLLKSENNKISQEINELYYNLPEIFRN